MGANYQDTTLPGDLNRQDLNQKFASIQQTCLHDYGHAGYTGTFAEPNGLQVNMPTFESREDAKRYVEGYFDDDGQFVDGAAEKWGPAIAVRVEPPGGKAEWYIGAWCSS